ncbi:cytokine-induced anti-apoptosis inhibitor 1, Fe-S biogenesis-domain-containing protein, partial [Coemansia spiralis]
QVGAAGKVDFEQIDRVEEGAVTLPSAYYDVVFASPVGPQVVEHSSRVLGSLLLALKPKGKVIVHELVLDSSSAIDFSPVTRTKDDLAQQLKFAGFVDAEVEYQEELSRPVLKELAEKHWKFSNVESFVSQAAAHIFTATVSAKKPAYNVGAAAALSFGKKAKKPLGSSTRDESTTKKVWMLDVESDDDAEIEDQDDLLKDEDLIKPNAAALARPDGIKPKRKPCKNCTCGLADGGEVDEGVACKPSEKPKKTKKPVDLANFKSSCNSCSLGDAFRCTSCPYLGMPAFKPGDKITLGGSMLHDDL